MGQYYKPVNVEKKEFVYSHVYDAGLKLMEHSYIGNHFVEAVEQLLMPTGAWHKASIVWAGDYADHEAGAEENLYTLAETELKPESKPRPLEFHYLVNYTKREVVDLNTIEKDEDEYGFRIHPLPLLTCEGNGRGGGDFHGQDARIGTWARDSIGIEEGIPEGFSLINGQFKEQR